MSLSIPRLSYKTIGQIADKFLDGYHPKISLPVPIEEIAEQKLKIKIVPTAKLKENYDIDGFLTSDLAAIFLDLDIYLKYENRTRFTIAHEVGHLILHGDIFKKLNINSIEKLNTLSDKLTDEEYGWIEYQAYSFASQVLVPTRQLFGEIKGKLGRIPTNEMPEVFSPIAQDLLQVFQVSGEVLLRRLQKEGILKL